MRGFARSGCCWSSASRWAGTFTSSSPGPAGSDAEKKDKAFAVEADKIEEFTITSEKGEKTTVRKTGNGVAARAARGPRPDAAEVSGTPPRSPALEIQRVIDESPSDVSVYNLTQPRMTVHFKAAGKDHTALIGRKTPPGSDLYARLDDQSRVVLIPSYVDTTFNRSTFDLRDKAVLTVNRDEIGSLAVTTPASSMRLEKVAGEWKLAQPVAARADFSAVEGLVSRLTTLQMKSVAAPEAADLAQYGLDKPAATATIGSGSSQATLALGKAAGEGTVYARDLSKPQVVTVESALLDELKKAPGEYRQKDLFDARAFNATRHRTGPRRRHDDAREGQVEEQGRPGAGRLEAGRAGRQGRRSDQGRQPDRRGHPDPRVVVCRRAGEERARQARTDGHDHVERRQAAGESHLRPRRQRRLRRA